jgi:hypothetical protein
MAGGPYKAGELIKKHTHKLVMIKKSRYGEESILTSILPSGVRAGRAKYERYRAFLLKIDDEGKIFVEKDLR